LDPNHHRYYGDPVNICTAVACYDSVCTQCVPGMYQPRAAQRACVGCSSGMYNSDAASVSACQTCPSGYFTNGINQPLCTFCPTGYFNRVQGLDVCTSCLSQPKTCTGGGDKASGTAFACGGATRGFCAACPKGGYRYSCGISHIIQPWRHLYNKIKHIHDPLSQRVRCSV
jgi:hypothetical protein